MRKVGKTSKGKDGWMRRLRKGNIDGYVMSQISKFTSIFLQYFAVDNCTSFVCTDPKYEVKPNLYDPVVDVMWKAFEITHSACFPFFEESYRMFHEYSRAIMDLWTKDIRIRWFVTVTNVFFLMKAMHSFDFLSIQGRIHWLDMNFGCGF